MSHRPQPLRRREGILKKPESLWTPRVPLLLSGINPLICKGKFGVSLPDTSVNFGDQVSIFRCPSTECKHPSVMALGLVLNNSLNGMDERVHASCVSSRGALGERAGSACMAATPRMMAEACIRGAWGLGLLPSSTWSGGRLRTSSLTDGSPGVFPFYHTVFSPFLSQDHTMTGP